MEYDIPFIHDATLPTMAYAINHRFAIRPPMRLTSRLMNAGGQGRRGLRGAY